MRSLMLTLLFSATTLGQNLLKVTTLNGTIQGDISPYSSASQFLSIPFAEPPVGNLRFAPPRPYNSSYNGTFDATKAAPSCIQFYSNFVEQGPTSEDCLYLDVYVPEGANASSGLPVKVWIYGGIGSSGGISDPLYDGCNLATDSIVVSINYRLGPLGFFALESAGVQGNMAVQDLVLGLEWVQTNIKMFGGDPRKVLVFGQSQGAQIAFVLSTLPNAKGLMRAIASESGAGKDYRPTNSSSIQNFGANWVKALNCSVSDLACIRSKSTSQLNASLPIAPATRADNPAVVASFQLSVDGKVVPSNPADVGTQVPAIFGSTTMEGTVFTLGDYGFPPTPSNYSSFLNYNFGVWATKVNDTYSLDKFNSTPYPSFYAMSAVLTDYAFKCPTHRALLKADANNVSAWTYIWGKEPSCPWSQSIPNSLQILELLNTTHTSEIPFVFANTDRLPMPNGTCSFNAYERNLSATVVAAWSSLAENGTPNGDGAATIDWAEYSAQNPVGLNVGNLSYSVGVADYSVCEFWDAINQGILANSTSTNSTNSTGTASMGAATNTQSSPLAISSSAAGSIVSMLKKSKILGSIAIAVALAL